MELARPRAEEDFFGPGAGHRQIDRSHIVTSRM